jgi:hypothetical protein
MDLALIMIVVMPALTVAIYTVSVYRHEDSLGLKVAVGVIAVCGIAWAMISLFRSAALSQRKRLGMRAEQVVGEVVNSLMREGFFVFHDLPMNGWNIDHVIIGETGVFSIETKGRRKHKEVASDKCECNLEFDGERISYPESPRFEFKPLHQARRAARGLEEFIEKRAKVKLAVTPLLVFPGWYVNRKGKSDVFVLNPTEIRSVVTDRKREKLSKDIVERVAAAVEAQCRDVVW